MLVVAAGEGAEPTAVSQVGRLHVVGVSPWPHCPVAVEERCLSWLVGRCKEDGSS